MEASLKEINDYLVSVFNDIMTIEETELKKSQFSDLSIKEMHTIEAIGLHNQKTATEVAKELSITGGTLTIAIKNLVKKGYVERVRNEQDRRVVHLKLTNRGRLFYRVHQKFHQTMVNAALKGLDTDERQAVVKGLKHLHDFLHESYEK